MINPSLIESSTFFFSIKATHLFYKVFLSSDQRKDSKNTNDGKFSHVLVSVKFCHVWFHKCTWYLLTTPQPPNLLVRTVYRFHVYFHVRLVLHELRISLSHEDGFSKVENAYERSAYYSVCDQCGVNSDKTWMYGDWFYTTDYGIFGHEVKATERSPPDNLT